MTGSLDKLLCSELIISSQDAIKLSSTVGDVVDQRHGAGKAEGD